MRTLYISAIAFAAADQSSGSVGDTPKPADQPADDNLNFSDAELAQERAGAVDEVTQDLIKQGESPDQAAADAEQQIEQVEQLIDSLGGGADGLGGGDDDGDNYDAEDDQNS